MRCYFLIDGCIHGAETLPLGLSDEDAIAMAHMLSSKRRGPYGGFEVWDRARFVLKAPPTPRRLRPISGGRQRQWADGIQRGYAHDMDHRMTALICSNVH